ncbi:MAG: diguanylate cyclase [Candidatus Omnitrophota bacterium]|jgi:diguanylate cyclase (GGDEF)-like protein
MANKILIIDDEPDNLTLTAQRLKISGYDVLGATNYTEAINLIRNKNPNLILLDVMMPDVDGFEVKNRLNKDISTASIPVIFLTAKNTLEDKINGLKLGVDDYITRPYVPEELVARIDSVLRRRKFYEDLSMTDGLTGLYNVYYFKKQIKTFFSIAKRYNQIFSLAIIDIDDFKKINDTYGHIVGDCVLKILSSVSKKVLRTADIITRYGGDEFAIILPSVNEDQAAIAMSRLKDDINGKSFVCKDYDVNISFSISVGVAQYQHSFKNEDELFELVDTRMYGDKRANKGSKENA